MPEVKSKRQLQNSSVIISLAKVKTRVTQRLMTSLKQQALKRNPVVLDYASRFFKCDLDRNFMH